MNGGQTDKAAQPKDKDAVEEAEPVRQEPRKEKETVLEPQLLQHAAEQPTVEEVHPANAGNVYEPRTRYPQQPQYRAPRQEYQQGGYNNSRRQYNQSYTPQQRSYGYNNQNRDGYQGGYNRRQEGYQGYQNGGYQGGYRQEYNNRNGDYREAYRAPQENYQTREGEIRIPKALIPYCGFDVIRKK